MNNLVLKKKQEFMGIQIPVIEGGFGEGQKVVLAKTIASIHDTELKEINRLINRNIDRFSENDLIDCLSGSETLRNFAIENDLIGSNRTQNVFILSQRGYTKLVAMMDNSNEKKWDVMNNLIDDYFNMKVTIKYNEQQKTIEGLNNMLEEFHKTITENKETIKEYKSMCKINSSKKHNYTDYIKKRLGITKINSEYEQVKARIFFILNINKWEDIDLETSKNILKIIDESITIIKKERPYEQMSYFN